mmetsp:Transcript_80699/g.127490  ORF Transcript_80699/g.127490 Transcript_80699/m.127490 type:complete len:236 (+) Transcript_80699:242-949(+)
MKPGFGLLQFCLQLFHLGSHGFELRLGAFHLAVSLDLCGFCLVLHVIQLQYCLVTFIFSSLLGCPLLRVFGLDHCTSFLHCPHLLRQLLIFCSQGIVVRLHCRQSHCEIFHLVLKDFVSHLLVGQTALQIFRSFAGFLQLPCHSILFHTQKVSQTCLHQQNVIILMRQLLAFGTLLSCQTTRAFASSSRKNSHQTQHKAALPEALPIEKPLALSWLWNWRRGNHCYSWGAKRKHG